MKRKHIIFLLLICLGVIFTSTVHGDGGYNIKTYAELMDFLNNSGYLGMEVVPADDFGWPDTNQTITITKSLYLTSKPWVIPKNIKLLVKNGGEINNKTASGYNYLRIQGKVEFYSDYHEHDELPAITVMKGGQLIIDDNDQYMTSPHEIIVKNGGILVLKGNLDLAKWSEDGKSLLNLEKGAIVKPSGNGCITLGGGTLKGNNVNTKCKVEIWYSHEPSYTSSISGTISIKDLIGRSGVNAPSVTIDKNAKVTLTDAMGIGAFEENDTLTLLQNARLIFSSKNQIGIHYKTINLAKGSAITAPNGFYIKGVAGSISGTVKTPGQIYIVDGSKLTIKNGGLIISTNNNVNILEKSILTISNGGILRVKNKTVDVNNSSVKGNGSIYIGKKGEVKDPKKKIASTIKIVKK